LTSDNTVAVQQTFIDPAVLKRGIIGDYHRIDLWKLFVNLAEPIRRTIVDKNHFV